MKYFEDFYSAAGRGATAAALIKGSEKYCEINGRVLFYRTRDGVIVRAEINGLPAGDKCCDSPIFAFHIHCGSMCTGNMNDPFADADGHYNPNNCLHPQHAGDMPPLFGVNGKAFSIFLTNRFCVQDIIGKTIIIHAMPDDFTTQPSGNAGEKIACGVITPTAGR